MFIGRLLPAGAKYQGAVNKSTGLALARLKWGVGRGETEKQVHKYTLDGDQKKVKQRMSGRAAGDLKEVRQSVTQNFAGKAF